MTLFADNTICLLGFASDGHGGIDCHEFTNMIQSLGYNLLGHHSKTYLKHGVDRQRHKVQDMVDDEDSEEQMRFKQVMHELCDAIVTYDKRSVLGGSGNLTHTLLKPFIELDTKGAGYIFYYEFKQILRELGAMLSPEEYSILVRPFLLTESRAETAYSGNNLDHIQSFRDAKLTGSLKGYAKSNQSSRFADFLGAHGLSTQSPSPYGEVEMVHEESMIGYSRRYTYYSKAPLDAERIRSSGCFAISVRIDDIHCT
jgi:Ca2+-binding EF-hand superfamily protein